MRKDLVRLRWAWLLWTLLLVGEIVLAELLFSARSLDGEFFSKGTAVQMVLLFGQIASCIVITVFHAMEDSPIGDGAFWLTRPVANAKLLVAKLCVLLLLFWLWPVVVALPWWWHGGMRGFELVSACLQAGVFNGAIVLLVWALAAISRSYGRFATALFVICLIAVVMPLVATARILESRGRGLVDITAEIPVYVMLVTCVLVILVQYLKRASSWAKGIFATGLLGAAILMWFDPRGAWFARPVSVVSLPDGEVLQPHLRSVSLDLSQPTEAKLRAEFSIQGGADDLSLLAGTVKIDFRWPDGSSYVTEVQLGRGPDYAPPRLWGIDRYTPDIETEAKREAMREEAKRRMVADGLALPPPTSEISPWIGGRQRWLNASLPRDIAERVAAEPPHVEFDFKFKFGRITKVMEIPFQEGITTNQNSVRMKVLDVNTAQSADEKRVHREHVDIVAVYLAARMVQFHVVDRERGTILELNGRGAMDLPLLPLSRRVVRVTKELAIPMLWRTDQWVKDDESVARSTLAITDTLPNGHTTTKLVIERLGIRYVERGREKSKPE